MIRCSTDYTTDTCEDGRKSDDGVQSCDHLRELRCGDAAPDDSTDCSADSRNGGKLGEHFRWEADCCERREDS